MTNLLSTRNLLLAWGLFAFLVAGFSAYDATRQRATDGALWLLGGGEARVVDLAPGGSAERAGLRVGDVIEGIDGTAIRSPRHAATKLRSKEVGDEVLYLYRRGNEVGWLPVELESDRLASVWTYLVYCALGIIYFLAGAYVFSRNSNQLPARLFFVLCTLFLIYFFSASERSVYYYWSDVFVRNMGTLASLMVPPLFLHFFLVFPSRRDILDRRRWLLPSIYLLPLLFYLDFTWTQFFGTRAAGIGPLQQMTLGLYFTAGLASLVSIYVTSPDPTLRQRVKFLTVGTVLGTLPFLVFNIALGKLLGREDLALLGAIPMVLVPVSFGYSIARYRLMDIEVFIRRSLIYAILTGLVVGAYLVLVVVVGNVVLNLSGQRSQLVAIIATLLIAAAFAPARERIQGFLERRFFREKHDLQQALRDLAKAIPHTLERQALVHLVRERVQQVLHPRDFRFVELTGGSLVLSDEEGTYALPRLTQLVRRRGAPLTPEVVAGEMARLARGGDEDERTLRREELRAEINVVQARRLELLVPAFAGERLVGGLALGAKRSEVAYDGAELEMLQIVAGQMGVQLENTRLYDEAIERQRLEEELNTARSIQQRLLPAAVPSIRGFDVHAINLPSSQVSGDYFDFVDFGDCVGLVIADVSGKGLPASLLASNLQASIRALATSQSSPGLIMRAVNSSLYESTDPERFATAFLACLHPESGSLIYSNAGHNPPLLRRENGSCEWLGIGATPLGAFPGMDYEEGRVQLDAGDCLVLFTDGVTEADASDGDFFGEEGLERIVHEHREESAEFLVETVRDAVRSHAGANGVHDDMTLIVVKCLTKMDESRPNLSAYEQVEPGIATDPPQRSRNR